MDFQMPLPFRSLQHEQALLFPVFDKAIKNYQTNVWVRFPIRITKQNSIVDTYYIRRIPILDLQEIHGPNHRLHCHENILVDQFNEPSLVFVGVPRTVYNSHLFDERGFTRLTSPWNQSVKFINLRLVHMSWFVQ